MSSRSTTFRHGPFRGWSLTVAGETVNGRPVRTLVQFETPRAGLGDGTRQAGMLGFVPGVPGFEITRDALLAAPEPEPLERVLDWVIEASRDALDNGAADEAQRAYWRPIVDAADDTRADWFAGYADGAPPAFEVIGRLAYVEGHLVGAR